MREWSGSARTKFEEANIHCTTKSVQGGPSGRRPKAEFHHPALDAKLRVRVPEGNTSVYTVHKHSEQTHDDAYATCGPSRRNLPCLRPPDRPPKAPVASILGLVSRWDDDPLRRIRFCALVQSDLFQLRNEYVSELRQVEHRARDLTNRAFTAPTERLVRPEAIV